MKVLAISGSPRKGNTDYILSKIYEKLDSEKELIFLRDLKLEHCTGCLSCQKTNECILDDDMKTLLEKLLAADIIIIGSPNYYGNVSGLMKDFIDRTHPCYKAESLKNKKLISIMVGGGKLQLTADFHKEAIKGFVKYNKLNLVKTFDFLGFHKNDSKEDVNIEAKISEILKEITF